MLQPVAQEAAESVLEGGSFPSILSAPAEASATARPVVERENSGGIERMGAPLIGDDGCTSSGGGDSGGGMAATPSNLDNVPRSEHNSPTLTIFLLVNTMIGAGILNMPQVFKEAGIFMGLCGFVVTAFATWLGLNLLIMLGERMGVMDYGAIARKNFGQRGVQFVDWCIVIHGFGAMLSYLITIGEVGASVYQALDGHNTAAEDLEDPEPSMALYRTIATVCTAFFVLPLCLIREYGHLAWISVLSIASIGGVMVLVIAHGPAVGREQAGASERADVNIWPASGNGFFRKIGSVSFALGCASAAFHAYCSMKPCNPRVWRRVTGWAVVVGSTLCCATGVAGYVAFRDGTKGEILDNFDRSDDAANFFRVLLILHLILYVPVDFVVMRYSLYKIFGYDMKTSPRRVYVPVSMALLALALGMALITKDFGLVLDLTGGVAGASLYYIVPAVVVLKAWDRRDSTWVSAAALFVGGMFVVLITLTYSLFLPGGGGH